MADNSTTKEPVYVTDEADCRGHRRLSRAAPAQDDAAFHHLRQRGRRQEHPDRAAALRFSKMIFEDQLEALEDDSKKRVGTQGQEIDFALLVDGLAAEREQGITIDVAYRFFSTEKRKFIVADCPATNSTPATW
jgi:hypothetical protein